MMTTWSYLDYTQGGNKHSEADRWHCSCQRLNKRPQRAAGLEVSTVSYARWLCYRASFAKSPAWTEQIWAESCFEHCCEDSFNAKYAS